MAPVNSVFIPVSSELQAMIQSVQTSGSVLTDFNIGSNLRNILEAVAVALSQQTAIADQLQLDSHLDTATGSALDALGTDNWMVPRNPAVQATGTVTITRQATGSAITLPAGFTQLVAPPAAPGQQGVAVLTTQDANFAIGVASVAVTAQAVLGGSAGDLANSTFLVPGATVNGVSSQNGFQVTTAFTGGVDIETDTAYRARIPTTVQGRGSKGRVASFQAATLAVPGVISCAVLKAGQLRGDGSQVAVNFVEVYYQGSSGLLSAVQNAVSNAQTADQSVSTFASVNLTAPRGQQRVVANLGVFCASGTDPVALALSVTTALQAYVNNVGVGKIVYLSQAIQAVLAVPGVLAASMPFTQFSLFGGSGAADIATLSDSYANLAAGDVTVIVTVLS